MTRQCPLSRQFYLPSVIVSKCLSLYENSFFAIQVHEILNFFVIIIQLKKSESAKSHSNQISFGRNIEVLTYRISEVFEKNR